MQGGQRDSNDDPLRSAVRPLVAYGARRVCCGMARPAGGYRYHRGSCHARGRSCSFGRERRPRRTRTSGLAATLPAQFSPRLYNAVAAFCGDGYENQSEGAGASTGRASRLAVGAGASRATTSPAATTAAPSTSAACCAQAKVASVVTFSDAQEGSTAESNQVRSRLASINPEPVPNRVLCMHGLWHIQGA